MNETVKIEFHTAEEIEARKRYNVAIQSFRARMAEAIRPTEDDLLRGTGRTTRQIIDAPLGSHYVCVGRVTFSEADLLHKHGRSDITLHARQQLSDTIWWRGMRLPNLILDHAIELTAPEAMVYRNIANAIVGRS